MGQKRDLTEMNRRGSNSGMNNKIDWSKFARRKEAAVKSQPNPGVDEGQEVEVSRKAEVVDVSWKAEAEGEVPEDGENEESQENSGESKSRIWKVVGVIVFILVHVVWIVIREFFTLVVGFFCMLLAGTVTSNRE